jgi:putative transposase
MDHPPPRKHLKRYEVANQARFLTFSCNHRLPLFRNDRIKDLFAAKLAEARERFGFRLVAWVVMPEHVHLLLVPAPDGPPVPAILRRLKSPFAMEVVARWRSLDADVLRRLTDASGVVRFWLPGGGYDRNVRRETELVEKVEYIHANPVRRGLVARADEWAWSSARAYAGCEGVVVPVDRYR